MQRKCKVKFNDILTICKYKVCESDMYNLFSYISLFILENKEAKQTLYIFFWPGRYL